MGQSRAGTRIHENNIASRLEEQRACLELGLVALGHGAQQFGQVFRLCFGRDNGEGQQQGAIAHHGDIIGALLEGIGRGESQSTFGNDAGGDKARGNAQEFAAVKHEVFCSVHWDIEHGGFSSLF